MTDTPSPTPAPTPASCPMCAFSDASGPNDDSVVYQDEHWLVRSISAAPAIAGWLILQARRHVAEPADWNDAEAATFGPTLRQIEKTVRQVTGAVRVYTASLNEGTPHFHSHILPRLPQMPNNATGFQAFGLSELARQGEVRADPTEVERVLSAIRERARKPQTV
ncbi:MAG TPA: HIT domain-containing protein [Chloroflexota bacterium]|nr:HIT domain-containing protein [Chloroflexota bacterium]